MSKFAVCDYNTLAKLMQLLPKEYNHYPQIMKLERAIEKVGVSTGGSNSSGSNASGSSTCNPATCLCNHNPKETLKFKKVSKFDFKIVNPSPEDKEAGDNFEETRKTYAKYTSENYNSFYSEVAFGNIERYILVIEEEGSSNLRAFPVINLDIDPDSVMRIIYALDSTGEPVLGIMCCAPSAGTGTDQQLIMFNTEFDLGLTYTGYTSRCGFYELVKNNETEDVIEIPITEYFTQRSAYSTYKNYVQDDTISDLIHSNNTLFKKFEEKGFLKMDAENYYVRNQEVKVISTVPERYKTSAAYTVKTSNPIAEVRSKVQNGTWMHIYPSLSGVLQSDTKNNWMFAYEYVDEDLETVYTFVNNEKEMIYVRLSEENSNAVITIAHNISGGVEEDISQHNIIIKCIKKGADSEIDIQDYIILNNIASATRSKHNSEIIQYARDKAESAKSTVSLKSYHKFDLSKITAVEGNNIIKITRDTTLYPDNIEFIYIKLKDKPATFWINTNEVVRDTIHIYLDTSGNYNQMHYDTNAESVEFREEVKFADTLTKDMIEEIVLCNTQTHLAGTGVEIPTSTFSLLKHLKEVYVNSNSSSTPAPETPAPESSCDCAPKVQMLKSLASAEIMDVDVGIECTFTDEEFPEVLNNAYLYLHFEGYDPVWYIQTKSYYDYDIDRRIHEFRNKLCQYIRIELTYGNSTQHITFDPAMEIYSWYIPAEDTGVYKLYDSANDTGLNTTEIPMLTNVALAEVYEKYMDGSAIPDQSVQDEIKLWKMESFDREYIDVYSNHIIIREVRSSYLHSSRFMYIGGCGCVYDKLFIKLSESGTGTSNCVASYINKSGQKIKVKWEDDTDSWYIDIRIENDSTEEWNGALCFSCDYNEPLSGLYSVYSYAVPNDTTTSINITVLDYEVLKWVYLENNLTTPTAPAGGSSSSNVSVVSGAGYALKLHTNITNITPVKIGVNDETYYKVDGIENFRDAIIDGLQFYFKFGINGRPSQWYYLDRTWGHHITEMVDVGGEMVETRREGEEFIFNCINTDADGLPSTISFFFIPFNLYQHSPGISYLDDNGNPPDFSTINPDTGFYRLESIPSETTTFIDINSKEYIDRTHAERFDLIHDKPLRHYFNSIADGSHHISIPENLKEQMPGVCIAPYDAEWRYMKLNKNVNGYGEEECNYVYLERDTRGFTISQFGYSDTLLEYDDEYGNFVMNAITVGTILDVNICNYGTFEYPVPKECTNCTCEQTPCTKHCSCYTNHAANVDDLVTPKPQGEGEYRYNFYCFDVQTKRDETGAAIEYVYRCACMDNEPSDIRMRDNYLGIAGWYPRGGIVIDIHDIKVNDKWRLCFPISGYTDILENMEFYDDATNEYYYLPRVVLQGVPSDISCRLMHKDSAYWYEKWVKRGGMFEEGVISSMGKNIDGTIIMHKMLAYQNQRILQLEDEIAQIKAALKK